MCTVRDLVMRAWNVRGYELRLPGNQPWISSARFDVTAKSASPVSPIELGQMLGPLLEDRFRLKWHREKQEAPVYFLESGSRGRSPGPAPHGRTTGIRHRLLCRTISRRAITL
jgi:uncharacterized protein (TIGR03435 family)